MHAIEARKPDGKGYTPCYASGRTQARHASQDADRLTTALDGREPTAVPGFRVYSRPAPFDVFS
ncbi:hypothetical protein ACFY0A_44515 [Streptomyces sp. NPDC001698]|uniref:hypothetical protein n=1 Tax=unclassified Streptomyces TaxID=2593676 RepID=UPI0036A356B5